MKHLLLILFAGLLSINTSAQVYISTMTVNPANPTNCTNTSASISMIHYCANYTYTGYTISQSGNTVTVSLNYTAGGICLPALTYPTVVVNLGNLNTGAVNIVSQTYLNSVLQSTSPTFSTTVSSCCSAVANFNTANDSVCLGDTVLYNSSTTNADSIKWIYQGNAIGTGSTQTVQMDSLGNVAMTLVAYADTCNDTITKYIYVNDLPNVELGADVELCTGDSVTWSFPGNGNSFLWSDGSTANNNTLDTIGTLSLTITKPNGCVASDTVSVTAILPFTDVNLGPDFDLCPGTIMNLASTGQHVEFLWVTGDTTATIPVQYPGQYWLKARSAGECFGYDTINIGMHTLQPYSITKDSLSCDSAVFYSNAVFSGYNWSNGATTQMAVYYDTGMVYLTVTDNNGCMQNDSLFIEVHESPNVFIGNDTHYCPGGGLILQSNITGSYLWSTGGTGSGIGISSVGNYWLQVTDANGCTGRDTIVVGVCIGTNETDMGSGSVSIFPNPTSNQVSIVAPLELIGQEIRLIDVAGNVVLTSKIQSGNGSFDVSELSNGEYFLILNQKAYPLQIQH